MAGDPELITLLTEELDELEATIAAADHRAAVLTISAGAGGDDAEVWAGQLFDMYHNWAKVRGHRLELLEWDEGGRGGIRRATAVIRGSGALHALRREAGVHRLTHHSPLDKLRRRHTSFAAVDVVPLVEDAVVRLEEADLRVDVFRSGGKGGQHANKTESAVKITHLPTGLSAKCEAERSQQENRRRAMAVLAARLVERARAEASEAVEERRRRMGPTEFGRQVRSYMLTGAPVVNDHRTGVKVRDVRRVLGGDFECLHAV